MRKIIVAVCVVAGGAFAFAAPEKAKKDSPLVAKARAKLQTKVTVEFKETRLEEVADELKKQVENLSIWIDSQGGVSRNQTITYQATDKPLAQVLDEMFKNNDLGYVVGKKKDGRYEGWLIIKKGKLRGDEVDEEKPVKSAEKTKKKPADQDSEKKAGGRLKLAKLYLDDGKTDKAKALCRDIVKMYPTTKAAAEAEELLKKLDK